MTKECHVASVKLFVGKEKEQEKTLIPTEMEDNATQGNTRKRKPTTTHEPPF